MNPQDWLKQGLEAVKSRKVVKLKVLSRDLFYKNVNGKNEFRMIKNYSIRQKQKLTTKYFADKAFGPK
jgi:hypothetical protein